MFGLGNKRKEDTYDEEYVYDDYEYEEEFDEYEDYDAYQEAAYEEPAARGRRPAGRPMKEPKGRERAPMMPVYDEPEETVYTDSVQPESQELTQEVMRLEETVQRLTAQLEVKQGELNRLTSSMMEKEEAAASSQQKLKEENEQLKDELSAANDQLTACEDQLFRMKETFDEKLTHFRGQIAELESQVRHQDTMKNDIATILIETKEREKEVLERTQWEADRIREQAEKDARKMVADASLELRIVKQEASKYRERLVAMKEESCLLFDQLLTSSDKVLLSESRENSSF